MKTATIPPKDRIEWKHMISQGTGHSYKNFVLQMKVTQAKKDVAAGKVPMEKAVDDIYELCLKYTVAVQQDFKIIFREW